MALKWCHLLKGGDNMKYIRFTMRITSILNNLIEEEAMKLGLSKNALIITILNDYIKSTKA